LINLDRVAREIKEVGLYNLILQDVEHILKKTNPTLEEIKELLTTNTQLLEDYKQLNVEYNLSNIHIKKLPLNSLKGECKEIAKRINENLEILKEIEKFTLEFTKSSVLVMIFSIEFFVLFSVQYFIVLLSLKEYQWLIYGIFLSSVLVAWWYANKEKKKFQKESSRFHNLYKETQKMLAKLENMGCIRKEELLIESNENHI
jgi:hypothetical protein